MKKIILNTIIGIAKLRFVKNFNWIVQWEITHKCNLNCDYCYIDHTKDRTNILRSKNKVVSLRPKYLIVSGGEPLIVPNLSEIIREVYLKCSSPYLVLNTNLTSNLEALFPLLDIINTLHISLDGLGEVNAKHRHISGDKILSNLKYLQSKIQELNSKTALHIATVVTEENYKHIPEMADTILKALKGDAILSIGSVEPYWSPISIINKRDKEQFLIYGLKPIMANFPERIILVGPLAQIASFYKRDLADREPCLSGKTFQCKRQFFRATVQPNGNIIRCKPDGYVGYYLGNIKNYLLNKNIKQARNQITELLKNVFINSYSIYCPFPCKCEEFLDYILSNSHIKELSLLEHRVDSQEMESIAKFCKDKWNLVLEDGIRERLTK